LGGVHEQGLKAFFDADVAEEWAPIRSIRAMNWRYTIRAFFTDDKKRRPTHRSVDEENGELKGKPHSFNMVGKRCLLWLSGCDD
jgi:hypothetical protein